MSEASAQRTTESLDRFITRLETLSQTSGWPEIDYDPKWPSSCHMAEVKTGESVRWRPVRQNPVTDMFERLEQALETVIHPDLVSFYSRYWSDPLPAHTADGELTLLQAWNPEDMERLRSNLIGHALAKQKQRQPLTLFFACSLPDGEYIMTINNSDGTVWVETPGKPPLRQLAPSLAEFIDTLTPLPADYQE